MNHMKAKARVMGVRRDAAADEARRLGYAPDMFAVANAAGLGDGKKYTCDARRALRCPNCRHCAGAKGTARAAAASRGDVRFGYSGVPGVGGWAVRRGGSSSLSAAGRAAALPKRRHPHVMKRPPASPGKHL